MRKRSGSSKVRLVPRLSSYHSELQKRVAIIGVSLVIILVLVGVGLYVSPGKFVGKATYTIDGTSTSCSNVPAGLVSWWRGENRADVLGNNNIPTSSSINPVPGKVGNAFDVSGGQAITGPSSSSLAITGDLTIMWWQKLDTLPTNLDQKQVVLSYGLSGDSSEAGNILYQVGVSRDNNQINRYFALHEWGAAGNNVEKFSPSAIISVDSLWHHIAVIRNTADNKYTFFIDGTLDSPVPTSYTNGHDPSGGNSNSISLSIGGSATGENFKGLIDEVTIFNQALTPAEVLAIYNLGNAGNPMCGATAGGGSGGSGGSGSEICTNGIDDDSDQFIDCLDTSCYTNAACKNQVCSAGKTVAWSYHLPEENTKLAGNLAPDETGCCAANQCVVSNDCYDAGSSIFSIPDRNLCDTDRNWRICTEAQENQINLGGTFQCDGTQWQPLCIPANKYKLRNSNKEICDGQLWKGCDDLGLTPILNPMIQITCSAYTTTGIITLKEMICNNGIDDDNDGTVDRADTDCTGTMSYTLNESRNEVTIKRIDDFGITITETPFT